MRLVIVAMLALGACGNSKTANPPQPVQPVADVSPEHAPYPYTAEQLRTASPLGRVIPFEITLGSQRPKVHVIEFVASDADGAELESSDRDDQGKPIGDVNRTRATWSELMKHAEFPRAATTIEDGVAETPAGKFRSKVYKVKSGGDELSTFYFAVDRPGPPVLFVTERAGERVMTRTLLAEVPKKPHAADPEPVSCTTDDDCWLDGNKPIARPATLKGKKVRPCKDAERVPVCKEKVCAVKGYKC